MRVFACGSCVSERLPVAQVISQLFHQRCLIFDPYVFLLSHPLAEWLILLKDCHLKGFEKGTSMPHQEKWYNLAVLRFSSSKDVDLGKTPNCAT